MATIREYYEKDFGHNVRLHIRFPFKEESIEGAVLYDLSGFYAFVIFFMPAEDKTLDYFIDFLSALEWGKTQLHLDRQVTLPRAKEFPGRLKVENKTDFEILGQFYGDTEWISTRNIRASKRVFIYSQTDLSDDDIAILKSKARELGQELQYRAHAFVSERGKQERPVAFISHDSRDKELVAKRIAVNLQRMLCPVWYDEFALKVGDNLRESVEKGLKECKKCILVLSPDFLSNYGWTKIEFDSIFSRQLLEGRTLVLPIWFNVTKNDVYEYSPSLSNVFALDWNKLGEDEVCRRLYNAIMS
jgi:hypothetical protein